MSGTPILTKGRFFEAMNFLQQNIEYDGSGNAVYLGYAAPGAAGSAAAWMIVKNTYSGSNMTASRFADGSIQFDKAWDSREAYSYA